MDEGKVYGNLNMNELRPVTKFGVIRCEGREYVGQTSEKGNSEIWVGMREG